VPGISQEVTMIPAPPVSIDAVPDDQKREEARRQAESSGLGSVSDDADAALGVTEAVTQGALGAAGQATGAALDTSCAMLGATVSLDVVGGIIGGILDI
jgi:hypothetical protein